jgi:SAM-dependent methyltransferase
MKQDEEVKEMVRRKYSEIAGKGKDENAQSCCGATSCSGEVYTIMADDYSSLQGYNADADLGLGCGLPTSYAGIRKGDTVIDLGSGAGNDCFVARHECGEEGKVIGIDFTEAMIDKATANADKLGFNNVEFRLGDIEKMPVAANRADVIVSNCVLNLVPDKAAVFREMFRVLKPGGHFSISDIVINGELPDSWRGVAELYAGCVSGAIQKDSYIARAGEAGFSDLSIQKEKAIHIPDDILMAHLSAEQVEAFRSSGTGIFSITLYGKKPETVCGPGCC